MIRWLRYHWYWLLRTTKLRQWTRNALWRPALFVVPLTGESLERYWAKYGRGGRVYGRKVKRVSLEEFLGRTIPAWKTPTDISPAGYREPTDAEYLDE